MPEKTTANRDKTVYNCISVNALTRVGESDGKLSGRAREDPAMCCCLYGAL